MISPAEAIESALAEIPFFASKEGKARRLITELVLVALRKEGFRVVRDPTLPTPGPKQFA